MHLTERQRKLLNRTFIDYHATSEFLENPLVIERAEGLVLLGSRKASDTSMRSVESLSPRWAIDIRE